MKNKSPPKKPLTAFFMFCKKIRDKGDKISGKEAGKAWSNLSDKERKVYEDEYKKQKDVYDKYLEEVEGIPRRSSSKKNEKPTCFNPSRIRAVCGKKKEIKDMSHQTSKALGKVLEAFMTDLGKATNGELRSRDKKTVTVEILLAAVEGSQKCNFLKGMEDYDKIVKEAEDAAETEKEKLKKAKEKKKKEKEEEEEEEGKKDKKGKKK